MRQTETAMPTALASSRPAQVSDNQPLCGACFNPISRLASAPAISTSVGRSSFLNSPRLVSWLGSRSGVAAVTINPGTTLIRNNHGHDQVSVIKPPTTGPIVGARTATAPPIVVAAACRRDGNSRKTAENTAGIRTPPENPCTTRNANNVAKSSLEAQPIEATVKRPTPPATSHRRLRTRVNSPVKGIAITSAIK